MKEPPPELEPLVDLPGGTPMILKVSRDQLRYLINDHLHPDLQIPTNADIAVKVPGGGDYSGEEIELPEIIFRWRK